MINNLFRMFRWICKLLFNRIFYVVFALLIQLVWIFSMIFKLAEYSNIISFGIHALAMLAVLWIVNRQINPSYKLVWTIVILIFPIFGLVLYIIFGNSRLGSVLQKHSLELQQSILRYLKENPYTRDKLQKESASASKQSAYITRMSGFPVCEYTKAEYFQVGDDMFPALIDELKKAEHYIFIEYFIINDGVMWNTILDILIEKAAQGVDVRLIYDDFGCLTTLPYKYHEKLKKKGIKCKVFNPFRPVLNIIQNNRDHRKLCIIDGYVGFTGGINLADEYINQKERFGHWKDTAVMLKGEAVWNMTAMFLHMWCVIGGTKKTINFEDYLPHKFHDEIFEGTGYIQPFCDSPLDKEVIGENVYLSIINRAKDYVYICTPYLIIDHEMMTALCLAARSGIDVKIMTPGVPDKKLVFLLTQSYYPQLLEAGVEIYEYQPGFLHAKSFVCDDEIGVVGTINLDYRSLYLHFEDGVWMYKSDIIEDMKTDFIDTLDYCKKISTDFCSNRKFQIKLMQNILRLLAPML